MLLKHNSIKKAWDKRMEEKRKMQRLKERMNALRATRDDINKKKGEKRKEKAARKLVNEARTA